MNHESDLDNLHKEDPIYKPHRKKAEGDKAWQDIQSSACATEPQVETRVEPPVNEVDTLRKECAELDDKYKRLLADQQNMQKRMAREREDIFKYAASSTIEAILPAIDNCDFALKSINPNTKIEEVVKGIEMLKTQLLTSLQAVGLEEIPTAGAYNAEVHEAISSVKDPSKAEGTIVEVVRKGFKLRDKVIRPSTVIVSTQQ